MCGIDESIRRRAGADLGGGCWDGAHPPFPHPEMACGFLIQLVFWSGKNRHQSAAPFLSGAPHPKKNPGSASAEDLQILPWKCFTSISLKEESQKTPFMLRTKERIGNVPEGFVHFIVCHGDSTPTYVSERLCKTCKYRV